MSEHIGVAAGRRVIVFLFTILALYFIYRDGDSLAASRGRLSERAFGPSLSQSATRCAPRNLASVGRSNTCAMDPPPMTPMRMAGFMAM